MIPSSLRFKAALHFAVLLLVVFIQINLSQPQIALAAPAPNPVQPIPLAVDALPTVSLNVPAQVLLGSPVNFTVTFDNTGLNASDTGYGPFIDLIIPTPGTDGVFPGTPAANTYDGLGGATITASYLGIAFSTSGANQNMWVLNFDAAGHATHPLLRDASGTYVTVNGTPGAKLVVLKLPFGSFTFNQPPVTVDMSVDMSNLADVGTPLNIQARGGYEFGYTPEDDFCCGDNPVNSLTGFTSSSVTPVLWTLAKTYSGPEDEAASGPNFRTLYPMRYTVTAAIAPGQSVTSLQLIDTLPDNLQFNSMVSTTPGGAACSITDPLAPGGVLTCTFAGSVTGTASITFDFYIPLNDPASAPVIDPATGAAATSCNNGSASAVWAPIDPRDLGATITQDPAGCEHTLNDRSIAVQKSSSLVGGGQLNPKKVIQYALNFQVSDFFAFDNVQLTDIFSDGQRLDTSFTPTLSVDGNGYTLTTAAMGAANYDINCYYTTSIATTTGTPPGTECETNPGSNSGNPDQYGTTQILFKISDEIVARGQNSMLFGGCVNPNPASGNVLNCDPANGGYNDGPTRGTIIFRTIVQERFSDNYPSGDFSVDQGDTLTNVGKYVQGNVQSIVGNAWTGTGGIPVDGSSVTQAINTGTMTKTLYALDGVTNPASWPKDSNGHTKITPGDQITYRIEYDLPTSDEENMEFKDYLPLPIFNVDDPQQTGGSGWSWIFDVPAGSPPSATIDAGVPASGHAKFGPADTFYNYSGQATSTPAAAMLPVLSDNVANNMLDFYFGDFNDTRHQATHVDLLFTATVSNIPFADGLYLTNEAASIEGSTNSGEVATTSLQQVVLGEPVLVSKKSVVWTSRAGAIVNPAIGSGVTFLDSTNAPRWTGNINSDYLDLHPIDSDISGVDAGDVVTFAIVIHNTGSSLKGAFDIQVKDDLPAQFQYPGGNVNNLNVQVYYGNGTGGMISYNGLDTNCTGSTNGDPCGAELFGSGIQLIDPVGQGVCQVHNPNLGNDIILITYDLQLKNTVTPGTIINTESLLHYASEEGGPNYLPQPQTDQASTTVSTDMTKALVGTEINDSHNGNTQAVIGELVTYQLQIIVPEGLVDTAQIVDTMDSGLAFVDIQSVTYSPGVTSTLTPGTGTTPANVMVGNAGGGTGNRVTINFGIITNSNFNTNNTTPDTVTVVYQAIVLNVIGNQGGIALNNSAVYSYTGGSITHSAPNVTVIESAVTTTKTASGALFDAGDVVTYTVTLTNTGGAGTDAFDATWSDAVPATLTYVPGSLAFGACPAAAKSVDESLAPTLTASISDILYGASCQLTFQATINYTVGPGQVITNTAQTQWTSMSGTVPARSGYNTASDERTGVSGLPGPGVLNDYRSQGPANIGIRLVAASKIVIATSETDTTGQDVAIGEVVRYRVPIVIPEGTSPKVQVRDLLPPGLMFLDDGSADVALVSGDASACPGSPTMTSSTLGPSPLLWICGDETNIGSITPAYPLPAGAVSNGSSPGNPFGNGDDPYFDLGDLSVNDSDATMEFVVLEYNAVVMNVPGNQDGATLVNQYEVWINNANNNTSSTASVNVVESAVTLTKTNSTITAVDAGDTITYTITISNTAANAHAPAYDSHFTDTLPATLTLIPTSVSPTFSGGASGLTNNSSGNLVDFTITTIPVGGQVVVTYQATVNISVTPQQAIANTGNLTWTSLPGTKGTTSNATGSTTPGTSGDTAGERNGDTTGANDYTATDTSTINAAAVSITKILIKTSDVDTTGGNVTIGEVITYGILLTVPEGTVPSDTVVDTLPAGLALVSGSSQVITSAASSSGHLTADYNGTIGSSTIAEVTTPGGGVTFTFSNIQTTGDNNTSNNTLLMQYRAVVLDVAGNVGFPAAPTALTNSATNQVDTGPVTTPVGVTATVVESHLLITKTVNDLHPAPGEIVTFTLKIEHDSSSRAGAFDLVVTDVLPSELTNVNSIVMAPAGGASGVTNTSSGNTVSATVATFPLGATLTITFKATVASAYGSTITNLAGLTWTSLPGSDTNERTGTGTAPDTYTAQSQIVLSVDRNLAKNITSSTFSSTDFSQVRIGDILTYQVVMTVPENLNDTAFVVDNLPTGLAFVDCSTIAAGTDITSSMIALNIAGNCQPGTASGSNPLVENSGNKVTFNFGTIQNANTSAAETITITYRAVVLDIATNVNDVTLDNNVAWNWGSGTLTASAAPVVIREGALEIVKTVDPATADLGSVVNFTITIDHAPGSMAAAYDARMTDSIPTGMTLDQTSIVVTPSAGLTAVPVVTSGTTGFSVYWSVFPLGESASVAYKATFNGPGPVINTATTEWSSMQIDPALQQSTFNQTSTIRHYNPLNLAVDNYFASSAAVLRAPKHPLTGFAPGKVTLLPAQPEDKVYADLGNLWLEVPRLGVKLSIVGIPLGPDGEWDLTWLGSQAGYLNGTAYPTHAGNSVITGHVYMADGTPGPFVNLNTLRYGDQVIVHLAGQSYIYEVHSDIVTSPDNNSAFKHEEYPWLTLITCKDYDAATNTYIHRVVVRAVLIRIEADTTLNSGGGR